MEGILRPTLQFQFSRTTLLSVGGSTTAPAYDPAFAPAPETKDNIHDNDDSFANVNHTNVEKTTISEDAPVAVNDSIAVDGLIAVNDSIAENVSIAVDGLIAVNDSIAVDGLVAVNDSIAVDNEGTNSTHSIAIDASTRLSPAPPRLAPT